MSIIPAISVKPPYATLKDFAPISNLASFPLILSVHPVDIRPRTCRSWWRG